MKAITRTISNYTIKAEQVTYLNGERIFKNLPDLKTGDKMTETAILKHFRRIADKDATILIKDIEQEDKLYSITIDDFMKYAKEIKVELTKAPTEYEKTASQEIEKQYTTEEAASKI